jgi:hypothetical protein
MASITTRATKGSALTWTEADNNITNLNTDKIENVVEDLSPQLGGALDVNGKDITSASNGNINIAPNGSGNIALIPTTGKIILGALDFPTGTGTNGQVLTTNGSSALSFTTISAGASALDDLTDVAITAAATDDVLVYNGTSWVNTAANTLTVSAAGTVNLTANNTGLGTAYPLISIFATGQASPQTDTGFTYIPSTGALTATSFVGALSGNATTATGATNININTTNGNTNDTTLYPVMVANNTTGNQLPHIDGIGFAFNATTNTITLGSSASSNPGALALSSASSANTVTIEAPTLSASYTLTLPTNDGSSNNLLQTNGTGTLTWTNAINGTTIGATTASTGVFTTLSATTFSAATTTLDDIRETVAALTYGATITPNAADGSIRTITLTGNVTFSAFTSPVSGQTITLIITQDGTGSRTLTSTMKFAGGSKTLSTAAGAIDILTVSYIGTTYYASLAKGFA